MKSELLFWHLDDRTLVKYVFANNKERINDDRD